ncbi:hypothetical protein A2V71_02055 [Candidatus Berkelbacteria bacterium RBG_13_40_8]|uniref:Addiction module toxin RelE n=1 Tax=Candidatus Berkelbacteria bacterium RBG_13_40_8 TaxID=1797467 RepID=A0A1F5DPY0_9BACT|nr:MAG: hypothetical protein A2V71_02055 [Candidatus Berkelbacteria bacterium RBG_13_40_8]
MHWNILLFETTRGKKPVGEFINSLSPATYAKTLHTLELLKQYGSFLGLPHCKKVTNSLYELRIRGKEEIRIFYFIRKRDIYLLHVFKKKTQKMPKNEIRIAEKRAKLLS